jgi:DNA recombination protein RmuC
VIDTAQNNIQSLARDVVGLQAILSNKQTRGAFGQSRMETIIKDGLPMGAFRLQPTLSNGMRPDCTIAMPNGAPDLVIDAKFPLEAWNAMREAEAEGSGEQAAQSAQQRFRRDMEVHIRDISDKYLIAGETQDTAFLFVPSESIFAEIHETVRGDRSQGAAVAGGDRLSFAADAVDPGDPGAAQGCADARTGASDPGRGDPADGRRVAAR